MSHTNELIDKFKAANGISSDYAAAKELKLGANALSNYRNGVSHADDKTAVVLADALGLDRLKTIARINADRAKKPEDRAFWKRIAAAAVICLAVYLPNSARAENLTITPASYALCIETVGAKEAAAADLARPDS